MRLVRKGTKLDRLWKGECYECGSTFEATEREVKGKIQSDQREGSWVEEKCTECHGRVILYPTNSTSGTLHNCCDR